MTIRYNSGSFGQPAESPAPAFKIAGIEDIDNSTHQESVAIPLPAGEFLLPALWLSRPYERELRESKQQRPGKK